MTRDRKEGNEEGEDKENQGKTLKWNEGNRKEGRTKGSIRLTTVNSTGRERKKKERNG